MPSLFPQISLIFAEQFCVNQRDLRENLLRLRGFREIFVKCNDRLNPQQKIFDSVMFVGGMNGIGVQSKSHQYGIQPKLLFEQGHDRNTSSLTSRYRLLPPYLCKSVARGFVRRRRG